MRETPYGGWSGMLDRREQIGVGEGELYHVSTQSTTNEDLATRLARWTPMRFMLLAVGAIFLVDLAVMLSIHLVLPATTPAIVEKLIDSFMLAVGGGAVLWYSAFRPLHRFATTTHDEFKTILDHAADAIVVIDEDGIVETYNVAAENLFGYAAADVVGRNVNMLMPSPQREEHDSYLQRYLETGEKRIIGNRRDMTARRKDGSTVPISLHVSQVWTGRRRLFVAVLHDICERIRFQEELADKNQELTSRNEEVTIMTQELLVLNEQLAHDASTDRLTNLLNRGAWEKAATTEHQRSQRHKSTYSVLMMDVDCFKAYNDTHGHLMGDECLRIVASCIADGARGIDTVGRFGGEEFILLAPETDEDGAAALAERIREEIVDMGIAHPSRPGGEVVTISIGVAQYGSGTLKDVIHRADEALYAAKGAGRNCVRRSSNYSVAEV